MELEGNLQIERPPTRRWIPVVGVVVPVVGFVVVAAWFIRAFIAPPLATIPEPGLLVAEPPATSVMARAEISDSNSTVAARNLPAARKTQTDAPMEPATSAPTQMAALSTPPAESGTASPFPPPGGSNAISRFPAPAELAATAPPPAPAGDAAAGHSPMPAADTPRTADIEPGEPITGPIPLPIPRPSVRFAQAAVIGEVPLPRPRPTDATEKQETVPEVGDRHTVH